MSPELERIVSDSFQELKSSEVPYSNERRMIEADRAAMVTVFLRRLIRECDLEGCFLVMSYKLCNTRCVDVGVVYNNSSSMSNTKTPKRRRLNADSETAYTPKLGTRTSS